jgi:hypothetical protein
MPYAALRSTRPYQTLSAAAVAVALASTAACSDEATAPRSSAPATQLQAPQADYRIPQVGATATVHIVDIAGFTIPEKLSIKFYLNGSFTDTVTVWDNTAQDKDLAIGQFKVMIPARASYKVCAQGLSKSFGVDYYLDACKTITTNQLTFDVGSVVAHRLPKMTFALKSWNGLQLKGAAVEFTQGNWHSIDNDQFTPGTIPSTLPQPGTYSYCEVVAPVSYDFIYPRCSTITVAWDTMYPKVWTHFQGIFSNY